MIMFGLDILLAEKTEKNIQKMMPKKSLIKLERQLDVLFQVSLHDAIKDFEKLNIVLSKNFKKEYQEIMRELKKETGIKVDYKKGIVCFSDFEISSKLAFVYADKESFLILGAFSNPKSVKEMLEMTDIAHSTAYRRISHLLNSGLLVPYRNYLSEEDGDFTSKYVTLFEDITVKIFQK